MPRRNHESRRSGATPGSKSLEKVTGQSVFGADVSPGGQVLHGKMVLSPHAHARITAVRTERAEGLPGVKRRGHRGRRARGTLRANSSATRSTSPAAKVRYVGDRIAAVAAVDEETAEEAARLIEVDYEVLPAVTSGLEAMEPDAPLIHDRL